MKASVISFTSLILLSAMTVVAVAPPPKVLAKWNAAKVMGFTPRRKEGFVDEIARYNLHLHLNLALTVRGGEKKDGGVKSLGRESTDEDDDASFLVSKIRHLARSLLDSVQDTPWKGLVKGVFSTVENIFRVRLLPLPKKTLKKTKASSASKPGKKVISATKTKTNAGARKESASSAWETKEIKSSSPNYRIQRELKAFLADPPPNLSVKVGKNIRIWIVTMEGAANTIYEGETFKLRIAFPAQYPQVPPSVYFLPPHIPVHEHVYTNGDICLSLLGKDWRPTMTAQSIAVSILSILSSAQSKSLPMDNARHAQNRPGQYQKDWVYHVRNE